MQWIASQGILLTNYFAGTFYPRTDFKRFQV